MHGIENWSPDVLFGWDPMWVATVILAVTYAGIISERINRAILALLGAIMMIYLGVLNQSAAIRGVDFNTIALLMGMMVVVAITRRCGIFQFLAIWATKRVKAHPAGILFMLQIVTAIASALLDNVTTVLLVIPVTLVIVQEMRLSAWPFLVTQIFASNIGGTATLIGDPPNILIGSQVGIPFNDFLIHLAPIAVVIQLVTSGIFHVIWGRKLVATQEARDRVMAFDERQSITDVSLMKKSLSVMALIIFGFAIAHSVHIEPGTIALSGAALLMLLDNLGRPMTEQSHHVHETFGEVEWVTIFFFVGLFVVVYGVESTGLLNVLAVKVMEVTGGDLTWTALLILWVSAIFSAIVDNIPFVATMIPLIKNMAPAFGGAENIKPLWWALALGACLGGNGSLIGASANLTVAGLAERAGYPISFLAFLKSAFLIMLFSIVIASLYLYLRYLY